MVTLTARISGDAETAVRFGSDGGIYCPGPDVPRGGSHGWTIDTSASAAGEAWWYSVAAANSVTGVLAVGSAYLWPIVVTRAASLTGASLYVSSASGVSGTTIQNALYASSATTGLPTTKIADTFKVATNVAGFISATMTTTVTLSPFTLYWMASWYYGSTAASVYVRATSSAMTACLPRAALPTNTTPFNTSQPSLVESSAGWSSLTAAPASAAVTFASNGTMAPLYWLQFTNA
jgi:hypothetical protein